MGSFEGKICFAKKDMFIILLLCSICFSTIARGGEYANCYTRDIDKVASSDYLDSKNRSGIESTTVDPKCFGYRQYERPVLQHRAVRKPI